MNYLKLYENFDEIKKICREYGIDDHPYTIRQDGTVDVDGDVDLDDKPLKKFPLKFGKVQRLYCNGCGLTTLKNGPIEVIDIMMNDNHLTTLKYAPQKIKHDFYCRRCGLKDLVGFPNYFYGNLFLTDNPVNEILKLVYKSQIKFIGWLNEYDVIRDGNKIVEMRLEEAYWMATKKELPLNCRDFKNYQII